MLSSVKHIINALLYSLQGLKRAWKSELAFRIEVSLLPIVIILLCIIRPGPGWSAALIVGWLLVMALELLNSAIEEAFDLISPDYNIHVKYGKDMASAAILMGLLANGVLWLTMLWDRFIS